jgi:hypothetical protein
MLTHNNVFFLNGMMRSILLDNGVDISLEPFSRCCKVFHELVYRGLGIDECCLMGRSKGKRNTPQNAFPKRT